MATRATKLAEMSMPDAVDAIPGTGPGLADAIAVLTEHARLVDRAGAAGDRAAWASANHTAATLALEDGAADEADLARLRGAETAAGEAARDAALLRRGADRAVDGHVVLVRAALAAAERSIATWADTEASRIEADYQNALLRIVGIVAEAAELAEAMGYAHNLVGDLLSGSAMFSVPRTLTSGIYSAADRLEIGYLDGKIAPATSPVSAAAVENLAMLARLKNVIEMHGKPPVLDRAREDETGFSGPSASGTYQRVPIFADTDRVVSYDDGAD